MRWAVRILAGLNALFSIIVGSLSVISPQTAAMLFKVDVGAPAMLALIRMFGALLASSGAISVLIAKNPERDPGMVATYAGILLLNVGADAVAIVAGEIRFDQLAVGMGLEVALAIALILARRL
jgi:hypothetical protein